MLKKAYVWRARRSWLDARVCRLKLRPRWKAAELKEIKSAYKDGVDARTLQLYILNEKEKLLGRRQRPPH